MDDAFAKEDIVEEMDGRRERELITAASAAYLNHAVEPTPNSFRSCVAPAIGRGSPPAFGPRMKREIRWCHGMSLLLRPPSLPQLVRTSCFSLAWA